MDQKIYLGPNVFRLGLLRNQIFFDGIPGQIRAAIELYPEIEELIVPIDGFTEIERKIKTKGEHLHHIYTEFERKVSAGVK